MWDMIADGGIILIDDYGYFKGCKIAVDEFAKEHNITICRPDNTNQAYFVKETK
jgi:hypothetical protein